MASRLPVLGADAPSCEPLMTDGPTQDQPGIGCRTEQTKIMDNTYAFKIVCCAAAACVRIAAGSLPTQRISTVRCLICAPLA